MATQRHPPRSVLQQLRFLLLLLPLLVLAFWSQTLARVVTDLRGARYPYIGCVVGRWAIAHKFSGKAAETTIRSIEVQVGRRDHVINFTQEQPLAGSRSAGRLR